MDVISVHAYPLAGDASTASSLNTIDAVRAVSGSFVDGSKPIWVTETGVTTSGPTAVSEAEQATRLGLLESGLRAAAGVEMVLIHTLIERNRAVFDPERGYGVITSGLRKKPAYCTLALAWGAKSCGAG